MSEDELEKVYIDANILVNYSLGPAKVTKKEHFDVAKKVFDDATAGKYTIVISYFLLSETLFVLRRISMQSEFKKRVYGLSHGDIITLAKSQTFKDKIKRESDSAFREINDKITRDTTHFIIEDNKIGYGGDIFQRGFGIMLSNFGDFWVYKNRCPVCWNYLDCCKVCGTGSEMVYKAVNTPDLTHLSIAEALGCDRFLTMDKGYDKIVGRSSLKIEVLRA